MEEMGLFHFSFSTRVPGEEKYFCSWFEKVKIKYAVPVLV